jgi:hypothetical protein
MAQVTSEAPAWRATWLHSPTHDVAMAFIWLPFAVAAHLVAGDPEHVRWLVSATLAFSFAHQPLTLWLVYGDANQRRANLPLFVWAPVAAVAAIAIGSSVRPDLVALTAGVWNVAHTLRQRYGIARLYGRMDGLDSGGDNRLLWSWLAVAVVVAVSRTDLVDTAREIGLGRRNATAVGALDPIHAASLVLLPVVLAVALVVTARWARVERGRTTQSLPRSVYLASTALLLVVLAVEPVTGLVAYVGAHAAEYLMVVRWRIGRAAKRDVPATGDRVTAVARRIGSGGTLAVYALAVAALLTGVRLAKGSAIAIPLVLTFGALHILYDGVIWHSPKPQAVRAGS